MQAPTQADLQRTLDDALQRNQVAGASIAIFADGKVTAAAGGVTNVTTGSPLTTETIMHIGSICKVFNATLVMQLVDEGVVNLDDSMLAYLPELDWLDRRAAENTTVRMLLNHTSGLNGSGLPNFGPDEETIEKGVRRLARIPRLFEPGEECSYCNPGTVFAGYIVQQVRQKSWYTVVRERVLQPLKMNHAAAIPEEYLLFSAAVGHYKDTVTGAPVLTSRALLPVSYGPAGATLMMSASNLITFARAHLSGGVGPNGARILSEFSTREMQRTSADNASRTFWPLDLGVGWWRSPDGMLYHSGGAPGAIARLFVHPASNSAIALLVNSESGGAMASELFLPLVEPLTASNFGLSYTLADTPRELNRPLDAYVGVYEDVGTIYRVRRAGEALTLTQQATFKYYDSTSVEETEPAPLAHIGNDTFLWRASEEAAGAARSKARIFQFRGADARGRAKWLGNKSHIYRRTDLQTSAI